MFGSRLLGVYSAANGTTHFVASSLLLGHMLNVSRTPSVSSGWFQSACPSMLFPVLLRYQLLLLQHASSQRQTVVFSDMYQAAAGQAQLPSGLRSALQPPSAYCFGRGAEAAGPGQPPEDKSDSPNVEAGPQTVSQAKPSPTGHSPRRSLLCCP